MTFRLAAGPPPLVPIRQTSVKQFASNSHDIGERRCYPGVMNSIVTEGKKLSGNNSLSKFKIWILFY